MQREIEELGMRVWWCGRKKEREGNGARNLSKERSDSACWCLRYLKGALAVYLSQCIKLEAALRTALLEFIAYKGELELGDAHAGLGEGPPSIHFYSSTALVLIQYDLPINQTQPPVFCVLPPREQLTHTQGTLSTSQLVFRGPSYCRCQLLISS